MFSRFSSFDRTDAIFVGSFLLRGASAGASFACAHTPHPSATPPPSPQVGKAWVGNRYLGRGVCRVPSPSMGQPWLRIATTGVTNIAKAFTLEGEGGFSGAGRKKTRMRVCFHRTLQLNRSFADAHTPHPSATPPPSPQVGKAWVGNRYLGRSVCRVPSLGEGLGADLLPSALVWARAQKNTPRCEGCFSLYGHLLPSFVSRKMWLA